jgi:hypothetical protein
MERSIARVVQSEGGGYAWTRKAFWLAPREQLDPRSGPVRYTVLLPRVLGATHRAVFYAPPVVVLIVAGIAGAWRRRLSESLLALMDYARA